tara:strand:+ start:88 stop:201 length:114 start_codon:yes stop_codon:yes gene_type:complete
VVLLAETEQERGVEAVVVLVVIAQQLGLLFQVAPTSL